jgi:signal transduction histidine kinase
VRIRQQEILAELGVLALQGKSFIDLLNHTARLTVGGMEAEFKYAFSNRNQGHIYVHLVRQDANNALVSVGDDGIGLPPPSFDLSKSKGLGMRIVITLAKQLGADITRTPQVDGNEFVVSVPCEHVSEG